MASISNYSLTGTDMSDTSSLDVSPAPQGIPISKLFSFCSPKKEGEDGHHDFEDIDIPIKGRSLDFESEVSSDVAEEEVKVEQVEVLQDEETEVPVLFDSGLVFQIGIVSAVLAFDMFA